MLQLETDEAIAAAAHLEEFNSASKRVGNLFSNYDQLLDRMKDTAKLKGSKYLFIYINPFHCRSQRSLQRPHWSYTRKGVADFQLQLLQAEAQAAEDIPPVAMA